MIHTLKTRIERIGVWVHRNLPWLLLLWVLIGAPTCLKLGEEGEFHFAKIRFLTGMTLAFLPAVLLTWIAGLNKCVKVAVVSVTCVLTGVEFYLFDMFHTRMTNRVLMLIGQTDVREAGEFVSQYVVSWHTLIITVCVTAVSVAVYMCGKRVRDRVIKTSGDFYIGLTVCMLGAVSIALRCVSMFTIAGYEQIAYPSYTQLGYALKEYCGSLPRLGEMEETTARADGTLRKGFAPPELTVWVIGESFNKHHSPLYGYELDTEPNLSREYAEGNLLVYTDAHTPSPSTQEVMDIIFSTRDWRRKDTRMEDYALLPTLLRNAGYTVSLHDNQTTRANGDLKWDKENMWFFNSGKVTDASLDYRNTELHAYDLDFVDAELPMIPKGEHVFAIFHLMGQHMPASKRYPAQSARFSESDYDYKEGFDARRKQDLMHYDNATVYNDMVLGAIIEAIKDRDAVLVYHSDHGEEIHDFRDRYGRSMEEVTPQILRCIYEIPLFVYTTPAYREKHAADYKRLREACGRNVNLADMSQFLLDLAGVESRYYDARRSVLSK